MSTSPVDPRWLEILKASGWQTTALTVACALIIVLIKIEVIPTDDSPLWIAVPAVGALIFACLSLAAIASAIANYTQPAEKLKRWLRKRREQKAVRNFIPYMTDRDKQIIGYLLFHNQKMFQANQDGGYAAPLISRGIIFPLGKVGQAIDITRVPFAIPDHIWKVLESEKKHFPYSPAREGDTERYPWAIPWMVR